MQQCPVRARSRLIIGGKWGLLKLQQQQQQQLEEGTEKQALGNYDCYSLSAFSTTTTTTTTTTKWCGGKSLSLSLCL